MRQLILILFVILPAAVTAQNRTFKWGNELCEFSGTYDPKKVSRAQLENTLKLFQPGELMLDSTQATVWNHADIAKLDVAKLGLEYNKLMSVLRGLDIVKTTFWENIRQKKISEVEQVYRLARATMEAYTKPDVLRGYSGATDCKTKYAEPIIAGGEPLLAAWKVVNLDSQSRNADPGRLQRIFNEQMASPDRLKFALVETMSFGWWNCANKYIEYDQGLNSPAREREFKKLFIRVRNLGCDEP